jgi:hypothetical protein
VIEKSLVGACVPMAWGDRQRAMETAQHWKFKNRLHLTVGGVFLTLQRALATTATPS